MSYDFALDMDGNNSNSVILRNIKPQTKIFEFGCAHGRMTKYLKQELKCHVTISEIDTIPGQSALQFADEFFVGPVDGDLTRNDFPWENPNYDYVIFADVLEHLFQPAQYLQQAKSLLNSTGSIWISIPNIAHNAVLIDLWNGKFTYREHGLLDNTHITFFTRESLEKMVNDCGLEIVSKHDLPNQVECTEFGNSYADVPNYIGEFMKCRPDGEIYQFVWELKPKSES